MQREYLRQWKEVTARDGTIEPQTILSTLWYIPVWFKYTCIPYILRYLFYCVWVVIKAAYFRLHKALVLQGAGTPAQVTCGTAARRMISARHSLYLFTTISEIVQSGTVEQCEGGQDNAQGRLVLALRNVTWYVNKQFACALALPVQSCQLQLHCMKS